MSDLFEHIEKFDSMKTIIFQATMIRGEQLYKIKSEKLFKHYAKSIDNWIDFLKDIPIDYNEAEELIEFYLFYKDTHTNFNIFVDTIPMKRLQKIVKYKTSIADKENILLKADTLPEKDWKDEINQLQGYKSYIECTHEGGYEEWYRCKQCGRWIKGEE